MTAERIMVHAIRWVDADGEAQIEVPLRRSDGSWLILSSDSDEGGHYSRGAADYLATAHTVRRAGFEGQDEWTDSLFAMAELMAELEKERP